MSGGLMVWSVFIVLIIMSQSVNAQRRRCMPLCRCENGISTVTCMGANMTKVPEGRPGITKLYFSGTGITKASAGDFRNYPDVTELFFRDSPFRSCQLQHLEPGVFDNLTKLKNIGLIGCPRLQTIPAGVFGTFQNLETLHIYRNGLTEVPDLSKFDNKNDNIEGSLLELDLHNNKIEAIKSYAFTGVKTGNLNLEGNAIQTIASRAFSDAAIVILNIKDNRGLRKIDKEAFKGITDIQELDVSGTSITSLPTSGLQKLNILRLRNTPSLKHFPSVMAFERLTRAFLTYPHHCCAFKNPDKQDPSGWKAKLDKEKLSNKACITTTTASFTTTPVLHGEMFDEHSFADDHLLPPFTDSSHKDKGGFFETMMNTNNTHIEHDLHGFWHPAPVDVVNTTDKISCGEFYTPKLSVVCIPEPDAFNPCEDVMGYAWLRVTVWFVLLAALLGNGVVLLVLIKSRGKFTVPKFLMCNLAFADFLMGVYLILIASIDVHTLGEYFNYAVEWQNEGGCQAAGFLSVFSSELSIFSLMIITLERWYAISHAIHLNKRLKMRHSVLLMILAFGIATSLAILPLFGVSDYGHVSICLPMKVENTSDVVYVVSILILNGVVFLAICLCYLSMYWKVKGSATNARNNDTRVAKRMALLVLTNFACWAPIAFFGLTASSGAPLIDITNSKILLVFFYPLNSCANPFLYAILTKQFRKDVILILSKNGLCVKKASRYRITYTSRSLSQSRGNKDNALHGCHRRSETPLLHFTDTTHVGKYSVNSPPKVHPASNNTTETCTYEHSDRVPEDSQNEASGQIVTSENCCITDGKRHPYVRSVSDYYINFDPKRCYHPKKTPKEQRSTETYFSSSTDATYVSDYSHNTEDNIWKIREQDVETEVSVDLDCYYCEDHNHSKPKDSITGKVNNPDIYSHPELDDTEETELFCSLLDKTNEERRESEM